jgi:hypothetical protein
MHQLSSNGTGNVTRAYRTPKTPANTSQYFIALVPQNKMAGTVRAGAFFTVTITLPGCAFFTVAITLRVMSAERNAGFSGVSSRGARRLHYSDLKKVTASPRDVSRKKMPVFRAFRLAARDGYIIQT